MTPAQPSLLEEPLIDPPSDPKAKRKICFFAAGKIKGQPRPRGRAFQLPTGAWTTQIYNPKDADDWKTIIRTETKKRWDNEQWRGPVSLRIDCYFARPNSHFGKFGLKKWAPLYCELPKDWDNIGKAASDALVNVGILKDDKQIVEGMVFKFWATPGEPEGTKITLSEL